MLFSKQTPAAGGTAFAQFDAAWCYDGNGYILNDTGTSLDVRIGASGSVQTLASGATLPIKLVFSMAELYVRRTDQGTTQVTVEAQVGTGSAGGGGSTADMGAIAAASTAAHNASQTAHGFGSYTVAQLNALTNDNRPTVPVNCSDCISFSPSCVGGLVHWSSVLTSWRLVMGNTVATTDWPMFCLDALANAPQDILAGAKVAVMKSRLDFSGIGAVSQSGTNASASVSNSAALTRQFMTGTTATGVAKTSNQQRIAYLSANTKWAVGLRGCFVADSMAGAFVLFGVSTAQPAPSRQTLPATFYGVALDVGNVAGALNAGLSPNWLTVNREGSVNLTGTGATEVAITTTEATSQDVVVIGEGLTLKTYIAGALVQTATMTTAAPVYLWYQVTNDGTASDPRAQYSKDLLVAATFV